MTAAGDGEIRDGTGQHGSNFVKFDHLSVAVIGGQASNGVDNNSIQHQRNHSRLRGQELCIVELQTCEELLKGDHSGLLSAY